MTLSEGESVSVLGARMEDQSWSSWRLSRQQKDERQAKGTHRGKQLQGGSDRKVPVSIVDPWPVEDSPVTFISGNQKSPLTLAKESVPINTIQK